jgi:hypothetical protein
MSQLNKLVGKKLQVCSSMEIGDILGAMNTEQNTLDLVKALDLNMADGDFTMTLIKELFTSLRGDFDQDEGKDLIKQLKKINKSIP